jgi:pimeloyl-ACP methyl ester carboxylesterase
VHALAVEGLHTIVMEGRDAALFVHGFGETAASQWLEPGWFTALESAGLGAIAYDLPGHGKSGACHDSGRYSVGGLRRDITRLLAHVEHDSAALIGHSLGARIALDFALTHPERVRSLVLCGVGSNLFDAFDGAALGAVLTAASRAEPIDAAWRPFIDGLVSRGGDLAALGACTEAPRRRFEREELAKLEVPVLVIAGARDRVVGDPRELADALSNSTLVSLEHEDHESLTRSPASIDAALRHLGC